LGNLHELFLDNNQLTQVPQEIRNIPGIQIYE